jgi:hypothetical protein
LGVGRNPWALAALAARFAALAAKLRARRAPTGGYIWLFFEELEFFFDFAPLVGVGRGVFHLGYDRPLLGQLGI